MRTIESHYKKIGETEKAIAIARNLLAQGLLSAANIATATGLDQAFVESLPLNR